MIAPPDHIKHNIDQAIKEARTQLARIEKQHERNFNSLLKCTKRYYETGIAFATTEAIAALAVSGTKPKDYFRDLAKQLHRPFINSYAQRVYISGRGHSGFVRMKVPKSKPMENLVSLLLVQGKHVNDMQGVYWYSAPLTFDDSLRQWDFYFVGKEGMQHYLRFRQMCRTNPVARIVLKLPVLPTE